MTYKDALREAARREGYTEETITEMIKQADLNVPGIGNRELTEAEVETTIERIQQRHRAMLAMSPEARAELMRAVGEQTTQRVNRVN